MEIIPETAPEAELWPSVVWDDPAIHGAISPNRKEDIDAE